MRVVFFDFGDQFCQPPLFRLIVYAVDCRVGARQSPECKLGAGIELDRLLQHLDRFARLVIGQVRVGPIHISLEQRRVDFHGPIDQAARLFDLEILQCKRGQCCVDFRRVRINGQRLLQAARRFGLIVFLQKQQPGLQVCWPIVLIELQRVGIELVDQERKLAAVAAPAGELGGRQPDEVQIFGRAHFVLVVIIDQPLAGRLGLVQLARDPGQFRLQPAGLQVFWIGLHCRFCRLLSGRIIAPIERQPRQLGLQSGRVGVLSRLLFQGRVQRCDRLLALSGACLAAGHPQGGCEWLSGGQFPISLFRLGVFARQQQLAGRGRLFGGMVPDGAAAKSSKTTVQHVKKRAIGL